MTGCKGTATMKWLPFMSSFVLEKMCGLIQSSVRTDKGFKEVHLNVVAKGLFNHCGVFVCSTQVYNHLRKWRQRWLTISRLRDLSGAKWCEDTKCIILEGEHYCGHVAAGPELPGSPVAARCRRPPGSFPPPPSAYLGRRAAATNPSFAPSFFPLLCELRPNPSHGRSPSPPFCASPRSADTARSSASTPSSSSAKKHTPGSSQSPQSGGARARRSPPSSPIPAIFTGVLRVSP
ncbi:hypothetical protein QYE76_016775 [Lolium multiflorum]|uniref:Uncharacterized protein n=1 Tax=Lolium multiflorum TaxID=4521 RepID=A0AAD8QAX3_LOLMU|nr:hypothetical protein QYE76_016775 [Lolium multiflorum]